MEVAGLDKKMEVYVNHTMIAPNALVINGGSAYGALQKLREAARFH